VDEEEEGRKREEGDETPRHLEQGVYRETDTHIATYANHNTRSATTFNLKPPQKYWETAILLCHPSEFICLLPSSPANPSFSSSLSTYQLSEKEEAPRNGNHDRAYLPADAQRLVKPIWNGWG
jgi:hypothetical protein